MRKSIKLTCLIAIALVVGLTSFSLGDDKIIVAVSIPPQVEFVQNVGGGFVDIIEMVPPYSSPETYEPTPGQMKQLSRAKVYFKIGTDLDFEINLMKKLVSINPQLLIIDCSKDIDLLAHGAAKKAEDSYKKHEHGHYDPHVWNSLRNVRVMIDNITDGLITIDSIHKSDYLANAASYKAKLDSLDLAISDMFKNSAKRTFIVIHPAWGYFARDYNLIELPIEAEGKEPAAADIKNLIKTAQAQNIRTVFVSPQFNSASAEVIAREIGGVVEYIDPLNGHFLENILKTAQKIAASLKES
ncbi:MAG: zinc ABC transporter solute-binding protein [candidate division Zixibacteria bacterium]|nr:zinc ABC transporter solute-binding protein [candidate division Zixibacteria bacterium]